MVFLHKVIRFFKKIDLDKVAEAVVTISPVLLSIVVILILLLGFLKEVFL